MKICLAQTKSIKGDLTKNFQIHLDAIQRAAAGRMDLIVFPELSLTGYEPSLAKGLAKHKDDPIFNPFQKKSDENNISIAVGMPIKRNMGIVIGMLIFQPFKQRIVYAKQILHEDETPWFVSGNEQIFLIHNEQKIAFGICYEALQQNHFTNARRAGATIYLASVSKSKDGVVESYAHFSKISNEFSIPILMVNNVGFSDNFLANGKSAAWDINGEIIGQLNADEAGLLLLDLEKNTAEKDEIYDCTPAIHLAKPEDLNELVEVFMNAKKYLDQQHIFQWTDYYPSKEIINKDLTAGTLYVLKKGYQVIGAITLNDHQDEEYQTVDWKFGRDKVLVVHRLVVDPGHQRSGFAKKMMDFAEDFAIKNQYSSIRLDTYTKNKVSYEFYRKRDYVLSGKVFFPGRPDPFYCLEKNLKTTNTK